MSPSPNMDVYHLNHLISSFTGQHSTAANMCGPHTVPALHESETFQAATVNSAGSLDVLNHTYVHS